MVATFRCNEIKNEATQLAQEDLVQLTALCERSIVPEFKNKAMGILKIANDHYHQHT